MTQAEYGTRPLTPHEKDLYQSKVDQYTRQWARHPDKYFLRDTLNDVKQILTTNSLPTIINYEDDNS